MPHLRPRHLKPLIDKSLRFSPIVSVFGHRQVGKTTLCEGLSGSYFSLDRSDVLDQGLHSPETLIRSGEKLPLVIDECQLAPPLFPALKEWVRIHKKPGQFLLTGSVRFSSRKAIRESLTGRTVNWELLPMDLSESHSAPLPDAIPRLLKARQIDFPLSDAPYFSARVYEQALLQGGLPGVFAIRDPSIRKQRFETQIETLLERDLRLLVQTSLEYRTLRNLLTVLATRQGLPLELSEVSRSARISVPALRRIISSLEAMFLIRVVNTEGSRCRPVLFFEDQGEASHLAEGKADTLFNLTRFLFSFIRHQWIYRPDLGASLFQFRSRGGAFVPLAVRSGSRSLGIIPMLDETPGRHELGSARSFLSTYEHSRCVFVHLGTSDRSIDRSMRVLPLSRMM
jgi:predicted AAA+ superfamily ATPase